MSLKTCGTCGVLRETRPYGKAGAPMCFGCAFASPEAEEETNRQLDARLTVAEAESSTGIVILGDDGPVPFNPPCARKPS